MIAPFLRCLPLLLLAVPSRADVPGAAFALNRMGNHVDGNNFPRKDGVYLSGGSRGACGSVGLTTGVWCFQVTDPAGTVLLTREPIAERCVRVANGVFVEYLGTMRASSAVGPCGALNVRVAPFAATPYPSGEYKIWLTRIEDYDPNGTNLFGFDPALSKSDNFRVNGPGPQAILRGHKFYDHDESGVWNPTLDPLELPVGGWRVEILRDGVLDGVTFTDVDGWYQFIRNRDGATWQIREISPNGFVNDATPGATWYATTPRAGTANATAEYVAGPEFGNLRYELLIGAGRTPSYWSDEDCGDQGGDEGEPGEVVTPETDCGRALLEACEPTWRSALTTRNGLPINLRKPVSNDNPSVSVFTPRPVPVDFDWAFRHWADYIHRNANDHAGFLLSREVAATLLSNSCGYMQGDIRIDRHGDGVLVSLDEMLDGVIGLLSEVGAGLTGPNDPFQDLRMRMQMCTNEFGSINNTGAPAAPQIVYGRSMEAGHFASPY